MLAPSSLDLSGDAVQFGGNYPNLTNNLVELTGLNLGDSVAIGLTDSAPGVEGLVQVWSADGTTLRSTTSVSKGRSVDFGAVESSALILVDWTSLQGAADGFEATASVNGGNQQTTMTVGATETITVSADIGDNIFVKQTNPTSAALKVTITDLLGTELATDAILASGAPMVIPTVAVGEHTVTFTNNSGSNVDATLIAKAVPPFTFGDLPVGAVRSSPPFTVREDSEQSVEFKFNAGAGDVIRIGQTNASTDDFAYEITDTTDQLVSSEGYFYTTNTSEGLSDPTEFNYFYAQTGGTYTFTASAGNSDSEDVVLTLENLGSVMTEVVELADGDVAQLAATSALAQNELRFFKVPTAAQGLLLIEALTPDDEDIDLYLYEEAFDDSPASSKNPTDEQFLYEVDAENHYVMVHAWAPLPSFSLDLALNAAVSSSPDFTSAPAVVIPDDNLVGMSDTLTASNCQTIDDVSLYVDITHDHMPEIHVMLTSPNGTRVKLQSGWDGPDHPKGWFPQQFENQGNLNDFVNEIGSGEWTLTLIDDDPGDVGTLNEWGLALTCE